MRAHFSILFAALVATTSAPASADTFVELVGGIAIPAADDGWSRGVATSPMVGARLGFLTSNHLGAMLSVDGASLRLTGQDGAGFFAQGELPQPLSASHVRVLAELAFEREVATSLVLHVRGGAGIDVVYRTIPGQSTDRELGSALEAGVGWWYAVGGTQIGAELALAIGHHNSNNYGLQYTSYDVDLLFGVRWHWN
jgi:hypothetical protein